MIDLGLLSLYSLTSGNTCIIANSQQLQFMFQWRVKWLQIEIDILLSKLLGIPRYVETFANLSVSENLVSEKKYRSRFWKILFRLKVSVLDLETLVSEKSLCFGKFSLKKSLRFYFGKFGLGKKSK